MLSYANSANARHGDWLNGFENGKLFNSVKRADFEGWEPDIFGEMEASTSNESS